MRTDKTKEVKYKKLYVIKWQSFWSEYDKYQYEGWNAFIGDDVIGFKPCFRFPFSTVTKCKIAVDLQERYNKDIKMLDVDPTNYNQVWGKYYSPDTLRRLAHRK
jgi:hypothetical protein